jgi:hypothetical protein
VATTDYDKVKKISIEPSSISATVTSLGTHAQDVVDSLNRIEKTLQSLTLNDWAGKTQQEADDFNNRWAKVMGDVFGSKDKPDDGALNALIDGLATAVKNYDEAELGLTDIWKQFAGKMSTDGNNNNDTLKETPPDQVDTNKTAITADYPPYTS